MDSAASTLPSATPPSPAATSPSPIRRAYLRLLAWAFVLLGSARVVAYVPTLWAIQRSGDSSQHSLWTWAVWFGSHATMAAWLHEHNGHRADRAVALSVCNASMCALTFAVIAWQRL